MPEHNTTYGVLLARTFVPSVRALNFNTPMARRPNSRASHLSHSMPLRLHTCSTLYLYTSASTYLLQGSSPTRPRRCAYNTRPKFQTSTPPHRYTYVASPSLHPFILSRRRAYSVPLELQSSRVPRVNTLHRGSRPLELHASTVVTPAARFSSSWALHLHTFASARLQRDSSAPYLHTSTSLLR